MAKKQSEEMSKSMSKRLQRKKEVAVHKRNNFIEKIIGIAILLAIIIGIGSLIGWNVYKKVATTESSTEFSKCLTDDGLISNIDVNSAIVLPDYENDVVPLSEVSAKDEEIQNDIDSALNSHKTLSTDSSVAIADQDTVNIDYIGTIDGKEFEGGNSDGKGSDLTIGSGTFVDDFETQLIGHKAGENLTVNVTFPENYSSADVAGKDASFEVTINGIYVLPEFNDAFVAENLSEYASTADEYRSYLKDKYYKDHLTSYLETYLKDKTTVNSYPSDYVKNLMQTLKYQDEATLQMYAQYFGSSMYNSVYEMTGKSWFEYEKDLKENAKEAAKEAMIYQAIYQNANLTFDIASYLDELDTQNGTDYSKNAIEQTGQGYLIQQHIKKVVLDYLSELVKVQ